MKRLPFFFVAISLMTLISCQSLLEVAGEVLEENADPTNSEIVSGLKQALVKGAGFAVSTLSAEGGYLNDPLVKIPFPKEAEFAANTLRDLGMGQLVDNFESRLNEGAEKGAKQALPIFKDAITSMSFADAKNILFGPDNAATEYFKGRTSTALFTAFSPHVKTSLDQVNATKLWSDITTRYNAIPFTGKKVETDLVKYTTDRALDGLFLKVEVEEKKIRENPIARTTEILKKVFEYASSKSGQ